MFGRRRFHSFEELFAAVDHLITRLEAGGHADAAADLRAGYACLNGLTDGWALFLESLDRVRRGARLAGADRRALARIRAEVRRLVHGHR